MSSVTIVGRSGVLDQLNSIANGVASNRRGMAVVVVGPPGIGKSTIAAALADSLDNWTVLIGRCAPAPAMPRRALTELAVSAIGATADLAAVEDTVFGAAVQSLLGPSVPSADVSRQDLMTAEGLLRLIASLPVAPVLVIVEDIQWSDDETLAVIDYLVDHIADSPVMILATSRQRESPAADAARDEWTRRRVAESIVVPPLTEPAVAELLNQIVGAATPADFARSVMASSEGNPLLVEEFAHHALDSKKLRLTEGTLHFDSSQRLGLPPSYRAAVSRRVDGLADDVRAVVQLAALCGRAVEPHRLQRLGVPTKAASDAIAAGLQAQLLRQRSDGPIEFRHALTREAVVWTVTEGLRRAMATQALDKLLDASDLEDADLEVASRLADAAGERRRACTLLIEAAQRAVTSGAIATALTRLDAAEAVADADLRHGSEIRELRVRALAQAGRAAEALRIGQELVATLDPRSDGPRRDRVIIAMARAAGANGNWSDAADRLDAAFGDGHERPAGALSLRAIAAIEMGDTETAPKLASQALEMREPGAVQCEAYEVLGRVARETSYIEAAPYFRSGVEAATSAGLGLWRARALLELGLCEATVYGRPDVFEEAQRRAIECGALSLAAMVAYNLGNLRCFIYDDRAVETADQGVAIARHLGAAKLEAIASIVFAQAHATFGRPATARVAADVARRVAPDDAEIEGLAAGVEGLSALVVGDVDAAVERYAVGMQLLTDLPIPTATGAWYTGPVALAAAGHPLTPTLRAQLATTSFKSVPYLAVCGHMIDAIVSGQSGDAPSVEHHLALASNTFHGQPEFAERLAGPRHLLAATVATAALAGGWGDPIGDLKVAEHWFRSRGIEPTARWCASLLRDAGVGPRRRGPSRVTFPDHLSGYGITNREYDVLVLLKHRLTNREIAKELTVSPATVKSHVERLLAKTGRRNRVELAELAGVDSHLG